MPASLVWWWSLAFLRRDLSRSAEKEIMGLTTGKTWLFLVSAGEGWSTKDGVLKPAHVWDSVYDTYHMNALRIEDSGESDPRSWKESFTSTAPVSWSHHLGKQVMSCSLKAKIAAFYSFVVARTRWYNTKTPPGTVETWLRFPENLANCSKNGKKRAEITPECGFLWRYLSFLRKTPLCKLAGMMIYCA